MKLQTAILPRRDGTVTVRGATGARYVFVEDPKTGELTGDVDDADRILPALLAGGDFWPAEDKDVAAALAAAETVVADDEEDGGGDAGADDEDGSIEASPGGLPIEANTPPKPPKPPKAAKRAAAKAAGKAR